MIRTPQNAPGTRYGRVKTVDWAGPKLVPVILVGEEGEKWVVTVEKPTALRQGEVLQPGETVTVPKWFVETKHGA